MVPIIQMAKSITFIIVPNISIIFPQINRPIPPKNKGKISFSWFFPASDRRIEEKGTGD